MTINLPFGNKVEIKDDFQKTEYAYCKKYRFKIVDKYGWDISKSQARDMRICSVLNEQPDEVLYHLYLSRPGMETATAYIDLGKSELKIGGDGIEVRFKCKSLQEAENLIDMILEPNELEVAPVNVIKK
jgi:hypothetical protein